jgi:hypothetical protein
METQNSISNEKILETAIANVARGMEKVGPALDKLTSASLKRVLKTITHVHLAEGIVKGKHVELNETEQRLIDQIFALQEDVMGYTQLYNELNPKKEEANEQSE